MVFVRKLRIRGRASLAEVESYRDEKGRVKQRFVRYRRLKVRYERLQCTYQAFLNLACSLI
jgi:hypothetical protein